MRVKSKIYLNFLLFESQVQTSQTLDYKTASLC